MARQGGWFKSYSDEKGDAKIRRLLRHPEYGYLPYALWRYCLDFCNESPSELRRHGLLYHSKGMPVTTQDLAWELLATVEEVEAVLAFVCSVGSEESRLLRVEDGVIRVVNWRRRQEPDGNEEQDGQDSDGSLPEPCQNSGATPTKPASTRRKTLRRKTQDVTAYPIDFGGPSRGGDGKAAATDTGRPATRERKLTSEQNEAKERLLELVRECEKAFYAPAQVRSNKGGLVALFATQLVAGVPEEVLRGVVGRFYGRQARRRDNAREWQRAHPGREARPVRAEPKDLIGDFPALLQEITEEAHARRDGVALGASGAGAAEGAGGTASAPGGSQRPSPGDRGSGRGAAGEGGGGEATAGRRDGAAGGAGEPAAAAAGAGGETEFGEEGT